MIRCWRPALGQFLSPDTLVPDAGLVLDYNRYMYARGNPVKYTDPTGHCAVLDNGSPDTENDAGCWEAADEWYKTFEERRGTNRSEWEKTFASVSDITEDVLRAGLSAYWSPLFRSSGQYHHRYNPPPTDGFVDGPEHPLDAQMTAVRDVVSEVDGYCSTRDCTAILIDSVGLVATASVAVVCIPGFAACGAVAVVGGGVATVAGGIGVARTAANVMEGTATTADLAVATTTFAAGFGGGGSVVGRALVGTGAAGAQLYWDHVNPMQRMPQYE